MSSFFSFLRRLPRSRTFLASSLLSATALSSAAYIVYFTPIPGFHQKIISPIITNEMIPAREEQIRRLKEKREINSPKLKWDLLVIGGGATGTGVALDAVTRGMKVALV